MRYIKIAGERITAAHVVEKTGPSTRCVGLARCCEKEMGVSSVAGRHISTSCKPIVYVPHRVSSLSPAACQQRIGIFREAIYILSHPRGGLACCQAAETDRAGQEAKTEHNFALGRYEVVGPESSQRSVESWNRNSFRKL